MASNATGVLDLYQSYVDCFDSEISKGTAYTWTPFRFCSEDWLLAVAVVRASRHHYEVALLGCEDHQDFEPDAGLKAALSFMLADSFHKTGKMALHFNGPYADKPASIENGYCQGIPAEIRRLAESLGMKLGRGRVLQHEEGRRLYCLMVGLDDDLAAKLMEASVDPVRCAFLLHRGVIGKESLELFADYSNEAVAVIEGRLIPERWLAFKRELLLMRRGIFAERIRVLSELGAEKEREPVQVTWKNSSTILLTAACAIELKSATGEFMTVPANSQAEVHLCALDEIEAGKLASTLLSAKAESAKADGWKFVAFTRDLSWLREDQRNSLIDRIWDLGMDVITIHESLDELDSEALLRLERFATTRMTIEEQRE